MQRIHLLLLLVKNIIEIFEEILQEENIARANQIPNKNLCTFFRPLYMIFVSTAAIIVEKSSIC